MPNRIGQKGISALPTILVLGGVIMNIAIAATLGVFLIVSSGFGDRLSAEALAAAHAGIKDGMLKVARNKDFTTSTGGYTFPVGNRAVTVIVCRDLPECGGTGKTKVTAIGNAMTRKRTLEAILTVSPFGEINMQSLAEVSS